MEETRKTKAEIGMEILQTTRSELYLQLPYLGAALSALTFREGEKLTLSLATEGETLFFNGNWLAERYLRGRTVVCRAYFHVILHCMLRHLAKKKGKAPELWDLACDVAVESILDELDYRCLEGDPSPAKESFYGECRGQMPVLTAEGIYRYLLRLGLPEYRLAQLQRAFLQDDHGLWSPEQKEKKEQSERQNRQWKSLSQKTQTAMQTVLAGQATGGELLMEQIAVSARDDVDYRAFLRRFAAPREVMAVDGDAFDPIFYTYGLQLYGNLPLIEPPETREERRIEDFVIAVDTSMSTNGQLVKEFLRCTYAILRATETFTRKVHIRILQCDNQIRDEICIRDLRELKDYMEHFDCKGGSATDFRPVFERIAALQAQGAFSSLRGLIYFTDGMGIYPKKRPPYEAAFVMLEEPPFAVKMPPWAIRLVLGLDGLEKAIQQSDSEEERDTMPEL